MKLTFDNYEEVKSNFMKNIKVGDKVQIKIRRANKKGKFKSKTLKTKARKVPQIEYNVLRLQKNPTPLQVKTIAAWLGLSEN